MLPVPPMLPSHGHVPARQSESPDGPSQLIRLESPDGDFTPVIVVEIVTLLPHAQPLAGL